jgi:hypothetical protein
MRLGAERIAEKQEQIYCRRYAQQSADRRPASR